MEEQKRHPFSSMESFEQYLNDTFGCIHCIHLETGDKPIEERKCTLEKALEKGGSSGVEVDKEWIRQDDIRREKEGDKSLPLPRKDINLYFMCDYFEDEIIPPLKN